MVLTKSSLENLLHTFDRNRSLSSRCWEHLVVSKIRGFLENFEKAEDLGEQQKLMRHLLNYQLQNKPTATDALVIGIFKEILGCSAATVKLFFVCSAKRKEALAMILPLLMGEDADTNINVIAQCNEKSAADIADAIVLSSKFGLLKNDAIGRENRDALMQNGGKNAQYITLCLRGLYSREGAFNVEWMQKVPLLALLVGGGAKENVSIILKRGRSYALARASMRIPFGMKGLLKDYSSYEFNFMDIFDKDAKSQATIIKALEFLSQRGCPESSLDCEVIIESETNAEECARVLVYLYAAGLMKDKKWVQANRNAIISALGFSEEDMANVLKLSLEVGLLSEPLTIDQRQQNFNAIVKDTKRIAEIYIALDILKKHNLLTNDARGQANFNAITREKKSPSATAKMLIFIHDVLHNHCFEKNLTNTLSFLLDNAGLNTEDQQGADNRKVILGYVENPDHNKYSIIFTCKLMAGLLYDDCLNQKTFSLLIKERRAFLKKDMADEIRISILEEIGCKPDQFHQLPENIFDIMRFFDCLSQTSVECFKDKLIGFLTICKSQWLPLVCEILEADESSALKDDKLHTVLISLSCMMKKAASEENQLKITAALIACKELFCKEGPEILIQELERVAAKSEIGWLMYDEESHALTPETSKSNSSNSSIPLVRDTSTLYGSKKVTSIDNDVFGSSASPFYK